MRILLDECLPRRLKGELAGHGDVFLTVDRNLSFQNEVCRFANRRRRATREGQQAFRPPPMVPELLSVLEAVGPGQVVPVGGVALKRVLASLKSSEA